MKKCKNCKRDIPSDAVYCPICGIAQTVTVSYAVMGGLNKPSVKIRSTAGDVYRQLAYNEGVKLTFISDILGYKKGSGQMYSFLHQGNNMKVSTLVKLCNVLGYDVVIRKAKPTDNYVIVSEEEIG